MLFGYSERELKEAEDKGYREGVRAKEDQLKTLAQAHQHEVKDIKKNHELEIKEMTFELNHSADERVKVAEDKATKMEQELAVAKKENEMLGKITDLNADVIDVKQLVTDLIGKLPNVNINAGISTGPAQKEKGNKE